jgi:hypothetical protein
MAALQQQLQEMYCMPPGPDHQEKVITCSLLITFPWKLKVLDMGIRIKLKEKVLCVFSTASIDVVSEYYSMKQDFALKPV